MSARALDTATISFGLVTIPIKVYSTSAPSEELHFHFVHAGCGERLEQQSRCPAHGVVARDEMGKGFELAKGKVVELEQDELEVLEAVASDEIALTEFVPATAVDPLLLHASYYLGPDKGGDRAYRLFRDALEEAELVGIATYSARGKQYVVMLRHDADGLVMHQLRYPDEVKPWSEIPIGQLARSTPTELALAMQIIESLRHDTFDASRYKDEVKLRVRKLIAQKAKGGEIVAPEHAPHPELTDLMAALKESLGTAPSHTPRRAHPSGHAKPPRAPRARPHATRSKSARRRTRHHG